MKQSIEIISWGANGPTYTVTTRRSGWSNRRRRIEVVQHGSTPNARHAEAATHIHTVDGSDHTVLFNKGYEYDVMALFDAEYVEVLTVDATEGFVAWKIPSGVDLMGIEVASGDDSGEEE